MSCPMRGFLPGSGPGSSERDYEAVGVLVEELGERFDDAVAILRSPPRDEPPGNERRQVELAATTVLPAVKA